MILEFGGINCWSFKEWFQISFELNKNVPDEYGFKDEKVAPILCFEGANASGKSCALRVLSFISEFCSNSFNHKVDSFIPFNSFFNNDEKSQFYVKFQIEGDFKKAFFYDVTMDKKHVIKESIYYKDGRKKIYLINRQDNKIKGKTLFQVPSNLIIKSNSSIISTLYQYGEKNIKPFWQVFNNIYSNVLYTSIYEEPDFDEVNDIYSKDSKLLKKVVKEIKRFDTGIDDIKIRKDKETGKLYADFYHYTSEGSQRLSLYSQSIGTKELYGSLLYAFLILDRGGVFIWDELDCHLNEKIVPYILNYFLNEKHNTKHAQLIFTSHHIEIIDVLKKYRTYLFNKEDGESYCYRIDEIKDKGLLRNDRLIAPVYKSGLLGGVPIVK